METILAARSGERRMDDAGSRLMAAAYEQHAGMVLRYIADDLLAGDAQEAEDLASQVWLDIAENKARVDRRVLDPLWLRAIARNVVRTAAAEDREVPAGLTGDELLLAVDASHAQAGGGRLVAESGAQRGFRRGHGDVAAWSSADFDSYDAFAGISIYPASATAAPLRPATTHRAAGLEGVEGTWAA